jgi:hypothetical protein
VKQAIAIVAAVVAVIGGVVFGISRIADVSPLDEQGTTTTGVPKDQAAAKEWEADANAAFGGTDITAQVQDMVRGAREWQEGTRPIEQFQAELDQHHTQFAEDKGRLESLRPFPFDKRVNGLYLDSVQLYIETANAYKAMAATPPGDMRTQLDLLARRVRALADRVFDRGHALVAPKLGDKPNPDVDIRLPEEVPNWVAEGLAPGPPLDDKPPAPSEEPQLRKPTRPDQPRDDWLAGLRALDLPPPGLDNPQAQARALVAAAERLRDVPDPKGDREEGARIRLSLLVQADGARAVQAGLVDLGRRLFIVGDRLWSGPGLPARSSGFDPALLRQS